MLTYDLEKAEGPLYLYIYNCVKKDIVSGVIRAGEKLPSKRTFARNHGISTITIQNAYDQLVSEGYVYTVVKKGYYVASIVDVTNPRLQTEISYDIQIPEKRSKIRFDLSNNGIDPENFPFSVWAKTSRSVMANKKDELMQVSPSGGVLELRKAIADHLQSFRGMLVDPNQIIIGAGTEYLYGVIVQLLGRKKTYAIENPGYKKLVKIYAQKEVYCEYADLDEAGITVSELERCQADVAHICPNHHFPTGITMPASRRYEILAWANKEQGRYIIEDDYDSEFRIDGKPIPTLFSIDQCEKVIYMNTFSKSLSPTIRISYMVLPVHLVNHFYKTMDFYACTVSNFEQYTLAQFITQGFFEKHINRMRLFYTKQRMSVMDAIVKSEFGSVCTIIENDSGLHFLLKINVEVEPSVLKTIFEKNGIKINTLNEFYLTDHKGEENLYIINYSMVDGKRMSEILEILEHEMQMIS